MSFEFLHKLEELNIKYTLIRDVNDIELNFFAPKLKHKIRSVLEMFFSNFVLKKTKEKINKKIIVDYLWSKKRSTSEHNHNDLMVSVNFLYDAGNQNTHSGVDLYNFDNSALENLTCLKRLHFVLSFVTRNYLGIIFHETGFNEMNYLKKYMNIEHKLSKNELEANNSNKVKAFAITSLGIELENILSSNISLFLSKKPNTKIKSVKEILKNILKAGFTRVPFSLGTIGISSDSSNKNSQYLINGVTRVIIFYFLFKTIKKEAKDRQFLDNENIKKITELLSTFLETFDFLKTESNNADLKKMIFDINLILSSQHTSYKSLSSDLLTKEIYSIFACIQDFVFELSNEDLNSLINGIFQYSQVFLVRFNREYINEATVSNFLEQNDDVIFPIQLLKESIKLEKDISLNSKLELKNDDSKSTIDQVALDKLFFNKRNNWIQLAKFQDRNISDFTIDNLYNDSEESYGWLSYYKKQNKVYIFHLVHKIYKDKQIFDSKIFEDIQEEFKLKYNQKIDFIPYFGYIDKLHTSDLEDEIISFSIKLIKPASSWNLYVNQSKDINFYVSKKIAEKSDIFNLSNEKKITESNNWLFLNKVNSLFISEENIDEDFSKKYYIIAKK